MVENGGCSKTLILAVSSIALVVTLANTGVWLACAVEYCEIYTSDDTNVKDEWEIAILWYTPPVVALVLMYVPSIFGIFMGSMCYFSAVGIAIAVFSTLSVVGSFFYICLELLALFGEKEDIYKEIFNRDPIAESETGEWLWAVQLGLTGLMIILTGALTLIGYCSCSMIDEDEVEQLKEEEGFPNDPSYGQFEENFRTPYMISKPPSNQRQNAGIQGNGVSSRRGLYNDDMIADHLRPRTQPSRAPSHHDVWSRQPTFTTRQEQHAESMEAKYARYGAQPAVGPPISRNSSTRRSQQDYRHNDPGPPQQDLRYNDPGPPQEPYVSNSSEPLYPVNQRNRRPKQQRNGNSNASILDYGKRKSNYNDLRLPRPQVDYDYNQTNRGYDYY